MRYIKHVLVILVLPCILTGCIKDESTVAYWKDCAYKSPLDYGAQQQTEMEAELEAVKKGIDDILEDAPTELGTGEDFQEPSAEPSEEPNEEPNEVS